MTKKNVESFNEFYQQGTEIFTIIHSVNKWTNFVQTDMSTKFGESILKTY